MPNFVRMNNQAQFWSGVKWVDSLQDANIFTRGSSVRSDQYVFEVDVNHHYELILGKYEKFYQGVIMDKRGNFWHDGGASPSLEDATIYTWKEASALEAGSPSNRVARPVRHTKKEIIIKRVYNND